MTLDEAIEQFKYDAECNRADLDLSYAEDNEQVAEWLEELKAIKSDGFTDDLLNMGFTRGYNKALNDFVQKVKEHQYVLSDVINSKYYGMFTIGIEQIAEQLKEGDNHGH